MADLRSLFLPFLDQLRGQSVRNRELYTDRLAGFLRSHGHLRPDELSRRDVNEWLASLTERGLAQATLAGYRQALKGFLRFVCGPVHPADHVAIGSFVSHRRKLPPEPSVEAMAAVAMGWVGSNAPHQVRDGAIFLLSRGSGPRGREIREMRLSEVLNSLETGADVFGIYRCVSVGKTGEVVICFNEAMATVFRCWLAVRPKGAKVDRLFVTTKRTRTKRDNELRFRPLSRSAMDDAFVGVAEAAGVRAVRSHALRHRLGHQATVRYSPKVAAMLLNHKDAATAATAIAFYHHPDDADVSQFLASMSNDDGNGRDRDLDRFFRGA